MKKSIEWHTKELKINTDRKGGLSGAEWIAVDTTKDTEKKDAGIYYY